MTALAPVFFAPRTGVRRAHRPSSVLVALTSGDRVQRPNAGVGCKERRVVWRAAPSTRGALASAASEHLASLLEKDR